MENLTTTELKTLIENDQLVSHNQYKIIDYKPAYIDGDFLMLSHQFDIIVTALTENKIDKNVKFAKHEGDDYFINNDLSKWEGKIIFEPIYTLAVSKRIGKILYSSYLQRTDNIVKINNKEYYEYKLKGDIPEVDFLYCQDYFLKVNSELVNKDGTTFNYDFILVEPEYRDLEISYLKDEFGNEAEYDFKNRFYTWCASCKYIPAGTQYGFTFGGMTDLSLEKKC